MAAQRHGGKAGRHGGKDWRHGGTAAWRHSGGKVAAQSGGTAAKLAASMPLAAQAWRHGGMAARRHSGGIDNRALSLAISSSVRFHEYMSMSSAREKFLQNQWESMRIRNSDRRGRAGFVAFSAEHVWIERQIAESRRPMLREPRAAAGATGRATGHRPAPREGGKDAPDGPSGSGRYPKCTPCSERGA
eukprot:gene8999-biopygen7177